MLQLETSNLFYLLITGTLASHVNIDVIIDTAFLSQKSHANMIKVLQLNNFLSA